MSRRIPSEEECIHLLEEAGAAPALLRHSVAVKDFALDLAQMLNAKGVIVDTDLVVASALLHDIMKLDAKVCHGIEGGQFLDRKGFPEVGRVVEKHCLSNLNKPCLVPRTVEEKLLMYADLSISGGKVVSIETRFEYIRDKYKPRNLEMFNGFLDFARGIEKEFIDAGVVEKK